MIREAICPTCHEEVEIDAKGRCKICGHQILETEKELEKKRDVAKKRIARAEEAERKAKQEAEEAAKSKAEEKIQEEKK